MLTRIHSNHLPIKAENPPETLAKPATRQPLQEAARKAETRATIPSQPDPLGVELMKAEHGEKFACHYYSAWSAAGQIQGQDFLNHYRALKHCAKEQGLSAEEFRGFERCLYQRFYRAACRDSMLRIQAGQEPRVAADELSYIAKVADIAPSQLERDAIALKRSHCVARMQEIRDRYSA